MPGTHDGFTKSRVSISIAASPVWAILDIVENIVGNVVDQCPELILCTLTTLFNKVGEDPVPVLHCLAAVGELGSRSKRERLNRVSIITIVSCNC